MPANLTDLTEVYHWWGSDLTSTATGDLQVVGQGSPGQVEKSNQRVLRRLMTNPGDYIFDNTYGAGVPRQVGETIDVPAVQALISGQMQLEPSVQQSPPPVVTTAAIINGLAVRASYAVAPEAIPAVLSFSTTAEV
jgi:hypothetical protein